MVACNVVGVLIGDGGGFVLGSDDEALIIDDGVILGSDDESRIGIDDGVVLGFNDELVGLDDNVVGSDDGYNDGLSFGTNGGILDDNRLGTDDVFVLGFSLGMNIIFGTDNGFKFCTGDGTLDGIVGRSADRSELGSIDGFVDGSVF